MLFTQELLALLRSGISLVEALETLAEKDSRASSGPVLAALLEKLREGQSFSSGLQSFPEAFPDLYVATVRASERTGNLSEALSRYVTYQNPARRGEEAPGERVDLSGDPDRESAGWSACSCSATWCRASPTSTRTSAGTCPGSRGC